MSTLTNAVIEINIGGTVIIYGEGSTPVITQEITEEAQTTPANKAVHNALKGIKDDLKFHSDNGRVHFSNYTGSDLDSIGDPGIYRVDFYSFQGATGNHNGILLVSTTMVGKYPKQTIIFQNGIYIRDFSAWDENGNYKWKEWVNIIQPASKTSPGLMSIDHFKSVEDMITNFASLVQSQTEIKQSIDDLTKMLAISNGIPKGYDTTIVMTPKNVPVGGKFYPKTIIPNGSGNIETVAKLPDHIEIKTGTGQHLFPAFIPSNDKPLVFYNSGAVQLDVLGGIPDSLSRLEVKSSKLTNISSNYNGLEEVYIGECPSLTTVYILDTSVTSLDFSTHTQLRVMHLGANLGLKTLILPPKEDPAIIGISRCRALKYSGITFPKTFRPQVMDIQSTAFTYAEIISMITEKWTYGTTKSTLQVDQEMLDTIMAGDLTPFQLKNVDPVITV